MDNIPFFGSEKTKTLPAMTLILMGFHYQKKIRMD